MRLEMLSIGHELLEGKTNTNVAFIGERIFSMGGTVDRFTTVPDSADEIKKSLLEALGRADFVILTGGLGPTFDDLTVSAVSSAIEKETYLNTDVLASIEKHFAQRKMQMPPVNKKQARIIEGAHIIENKIGTAPGQFIELKGGKKIVVLLPGPPRELQPMFEQNVAPYFKKRVAKLRKSIVIRTFGLAESEVEQRIQKIISDEKIIDRGLLSMTILAHGGMVDIKITSTGTDELLVDEAIHNVKKELLDALGDFVFGFNSDTLESVVGVLLMKHKLNIAVAESCTAGIISAKLANIPGSSHYLVEGLSVYSNGSKISRLNISPKTLETYGAVSKECAQEMLDGLKNSSNSYCQIAVTGIAGPTGAVKEKPVGNVYIGVHTPLSKKISEHQLNGSRNEIRERAALLALDLLRKELLEYK